MARCALVCAALLTFSVILQEAPGGELVLADGGRSAYQIVVADDASPSIRHAAEELQSFLEQITGAKLPIASDKQPLTPHEIVLGNNAHLKQLGVDVDFKSLGNEGYVIRTVGDRLVIAGGSLRGNLYGVYGLLEDHLGCRWFAPGVSRIPKQSRLTLAATDQRYLPPLESRDLALADCLDGDWCARNRLNGSFGKLEERHGGKVVFGEDFFVHTAERLIPPDKYFDKHPEYFALIKGKRQKKEPQLCWTNPEVIQLCIDGVRKAMREQPKATVFSVSQNDYTTYCECDKCQALAREEESQMAPVLQLANRVAEAIETEFPDKLIETLAYQWSRRPPKNMRPRSNVIVRLCSIECCFAHPLATCNSDENRAFREDIVAWSKLNTRLWIWDYTTDFHAYLLPYPNLRVRGPNVDFFVKHGVRGIMEQDTYNTTQGELSALGGYVSAKCLWNPKYDVNRAITEFLDGYYGKAAAPIHAYIDLLHDRVAKENIHIVCWCAIESPHLTNELLTKANQLWQQAESLVSDQPEVMRRVKLSRMSVDYAILERGRLQSLKKLPYDEQFRPLVESRLNPFFSTFEDCDLTRIREWYPVDKAKYRRELIRDLGVKQ